MRGDSWLRTHLKSVWTGREAEAGVFRGTWSSWILQSTLTQWIAALSGLEGPSLTQPATSCQLGERTYGQALTVTGNMSQSI